MENSGDTINPSLVLDALELLRLILELLLDFSPRFDCRFFDLLFQSSFPFSLRHNFRRYLQRAPRKSTLDVTSRIRRPPVRPRKESSVLLS